MVTTSPVDDSDQGDDERAKNAARRTFLATVIALVVVVLGYWLLIPGAGHHDIGQALQFAGTPERLNDRLAEHEISVGDARNAMWLAMLFSALWGAVGFWLLTKHWAGAWKAGVGTKISGTLLGAGLGLGGGAIGLVEKGLTLATVREDGSRVAFADSPGSVVPKAVVTLAWAKWLLAGLMIAIVVAMLVSSATAAVRRKLPGAREGVPDDLPSEHGGAEPDGTGICCSGGGIRAAGFALGALARLEKEPDSAKSVGKLGVLGRAKYLASVSGGGYAAAGWRIAAGTKDLPDDPIIGDPTDPALDASIRKYPDAAVSAGTLAQHVRERRRYLGNGPGGLLRSVLIVVRNMAFHFSLLLVSVVVLAWPLGRAVVSWAITGDGRAPDRMSAGLTTDIGIHQWLPPVVAAVAAAPLVLWRLGLDRSPLRRRVDVAITGLLGMAASLTVLLIALPFAVDWLISALPEGGGQRLAVAGVYGAIVTAVWQAAKSRLKAVARYLGGVFLAAGLFVFGLLVMAHAADTDEWFSSFWVWGACLVAVIVAFILFNPDRWSLHGFYRKRLAGTFATQRQPDGGLLSHPGEPPLHAYRPAAGPKPIICCAAARQESHQTGIPVLSMTFEPSCVTVSRWSGAQSTATLQSERISHAQFQRRLPRSRQGHHLQTAMGAAAISGAAVAPSLGRKSMKGTDALLAAFNARLGVWVPNPAQQSYRWSTTPRLVNMFKEIFKTYDPLDPNVYASDGGHWENLGLVELIRRRCATIIVIDASGDAPGTYGALKEAIKLAKLECGATVELSPESWEHLAVDADNVAGRNFGIGTVTYDDNNDDDNNDDNNNDDDNSEVKTATLLYVKAAVMASTPLHILRYAANDPRFPNYSTADQLLTSEELSHLMHLGYASMDEAIAKHPEFAA